MEYDGTLLCKYKIQQIFLLKLLHFSYAKEVLNIFQQINDARCIGCQYNILSLQYHECLTNSKYQVLSYHYDEAFQSLDFDRISNLFNTVVSTLNIPLHFIHKFKEAFNWDWWKENTEEKYNTMNKIQEYTRILSVLAEIK